jgi:hypothetical protein
VALLYVPAVHSTGAAEPAEHHAPAGQRAAKGVVDPGAQKKPALQAPEHTDTAMPTAAPKVPPGHGAGAPAPAMQNEPKGQTAAVEFVEPAGQ